MFCYSFARTFYSINVFTVKKYIFCVCSLIRLEWSKICEFLVSTNKSSPLGEIVIEIKHMRIIEPEPGFVGSGPERRAGSGDENVS